MDITAIEAITALSNSSGEHFMHFVTVFFGYMVAVHFIGSGIPGRFAVALSVIYSLFCILPAFATFQANTFALQIGAPMPPYLRFVPVAVIFAAWTVSIWYMFHVRSSTNDA